MIFINKLKRRNTYTVKFIQSLLVFLIIQVSTAQWEVGEFGNNFDGKTKYASIRGTGSNPSYDKPILSVQYVKSDNSGFIAIVDNFDFHKNQGEKSILFYFDDSEDIFKIDRYYNNGVAVYLIRILDPNNEDNSLSGYELIRLLKTAKSITFRFINGSNFNDLFFELDGSNAAICEVFPNLDEIIQKEEDRHYNLLNAPINRALQSGRLRKKLEEQGLTYSSIEAVSDTINYKMRIGIYEDEPGHPDYIEDLFVVPIEDKGRFTGDVYIVLIGLHNSKAIDDIYKVELDAEIWDTILKESKGFDTSLMKLLPLPGLIEIIEERVVELSQRSFSSWKFGKSAINWGIGDVIDMKYTFGKPRKGLIKEIKILALIPNNIWIQSKIDISQLEITEDKLKELGIEPGIKFSYKIN